MAMQDSWQGIASNSFQELFQRWKATSDLVETQLGQLGQALALAANQYSETEMANQRLFM
jgi:WXG100 family type VII secretion target